MQELQTLKAQYHRQEVEVKNAHAEKKNTQEIYEAEVQRLANVCKSLEKQVLRLTQDNDVLRNTVNEQEKQVERLTGTKSKAKHLLLSAIKIASEQI